MRSLYATLSLPFLSAAIHLEGEKEIVIYQDDLEGKGLHCGQCVCEMDAL